MLSLALLMAAQQVPEPPLSDAEIVVIGRRLDSVTVSVGQGPDGKWYCSMDGTSSVLSLDKKICKAVTKCVQKGARSDAAVQGCIQKSKKRLFAKFKRERTKRR